MYLVSWLVGVTLVGCVCIPLVIEHRLFHRGFLLGIERFELFFEALYASRITLLFLLYRTQEHPSGVVSCVVVSFFFLSVAFESQ